ncbi:MAG: CcmD family protein [Cyclobacteriaceae bacterium]|nr:CcmD family protein [Cyclobacteriaceae bacterium]
MRKLIAFILVLISLNIFAQDKIPVTKGDYNNQEVEMADTFRSEGKIYVVVAIVSIILIGLLSYTAFIDKKLSRLEKEHGID